MSKLRCHISISLDGFVAGPDQSEENPLGEGGERLHEWAVRLKTFRELHGLEGGEEGSDDELFRASVARQGAVVMGRKMFSGGAGSWEDDPNADGWWGREPPFRKAVFVVTHHEREPLVLGRTTFNFVIDGVESAVEQARAAAGNRDVHVAGGAELVGQALAAGLVDELLLHLAPTLLGDGVRLFEGLAPATLELTQLAESPTGVVHLRYRPVF